MLKVISEGNTTQMEEAHGDQSWDNVNIKKNGLVRHWWLTPVILVTQEVEIRRIVARNQPGQIVLETLSRKNPTQKGLVE
jgi:hypothetical protein